MGSGCTPPTCFPSTPKAAFAVETVPALEGGTCAAPVAPLSLPSGDPALRAIVSCGGNQVRCGAADYRVGDGDRDQVTCTVSGTGTVHLDAHASSGGDAVEAVGDVSEQGAPITITATDATGTKVLDAARCTAVTRYATAGTIYADFTCDAVGAGDAGSAGDAGGARGAGCVVRGTLVFEGCGAG